MCYTKKKFVFLKEGFLLKYWRGYLIAVIVLALTTALTMMADRFSLLVDMIYPYASRTILSTLAGWSATVDFTLWQVLAVFLVVGLLATIVLMIMLKWNFFQWLGWILAGASLIWCLHTGIYGLNNHASSLAEDLRLNVTEYTLGELEEATIFFRDKANEMAAQIDRTEAREAIFKDFDELAAQAGEGFRNMTYSGEAAVFAGSLIPVKELGWAEMYSSMGIMGMTMPITGEAAVNPLIPKVAMPFTMCHEMAHRMAIAPERDANLAGFLTCIANSDPQFQYSGWFMAYRYCYNALASDGSADAAVAAARIATGVNEYLKADINSYNNFFAVYYNPTASDIADAANDAYIKVSGDSSGVKSYGEVCDLMVSWYIQEVLVPTHGETESGFDPYDKDQIDLSDIMEGR